MMVFKSHREERALYSGTSAPTPIPTPHNAAQRAPHTTVQHTATDLSISQPLSEVSYTPPSPQEEMTMEELCVSEDEGDSGFGVAERRCEEEQQHDHDHHPDHNHHARYDTLFGGVHLSAQNRFGHAASPLHPPVLTTPVAATPQSTTPTTTWRGGGVTQSTAAAASTHRRHWAQPQLCPVSTPTPKRAALHTLPQLLPSNSDLSVSDLGKEQKPTPRTAWGMKESVQQPPQSANQTVQMARSSTSSDIFAENEEQAAPFVMDGGESPAARVPFGAPVGAPPQAAQYTHHPEEETFTPAANPAPAVSHAVSASPPQRATSRSRSTETKIEGQLRSLEAQVAEASERLRLFAASRSEEPLLRRSMSPEVRGEEEEEEEEGEGKGQEKEVGVGAKPVRRGLAVLDPNSVAQR